MIAGGKVFVVWPQSFPKNFKVQPVCVNLVWIWNHRYQTSFSANHPQSKFVSRELAGIKLTGKVLSGHLQYDFHC